MSEPITKAEENYVAGLTQRQMLWLGHRCKSMGMTIYGVLREGYKPPHHLLLRNDGLEVQVVEAKDQSQELAYAIWTSTIDCPDGVDMAQVNRIAAIIRPVLEQASTPRLLELETAIVAWANQFSGENHKLTEAGKKLRQLAKEIEHLRLAH